MAERRMLSKKITDHDNFTSLSASAQALYMHLNLSADDEGFCNQVSLCMFKAHAGTQDLEALIEKRYLLRFDSGVILIKHWKVNNTLRNDRLKPSSYEEEKAQIVEKSDGSYSWLPNDGQMSDTWLPNGCPNITKHNISKDNINSCSSSKGGIDFLDLLSSDEISELKKMFTDHYALMDACQKDATQKHKTIRKPFNYIVGYAHNVGWPERT